MTGSSHEDVTRSSEVQLPSERSFGLVFTAVFVVVGVLPVIQGEAPRIWAFIVAAVLLLISLVSPGLLRPANRLWFKFGLLLHRIVSPIVLGLIYFGVFAPIGFFLRLRGKRPLALDYDPSASTYWTQRGEAAPDAESLKRLF